METVKADDTAKMGMCSSFFEILFLEMYGTACSEENMMRFSQRRFGLWNSSCSILENLQNICWLPLLYNLVFSGKGPEPAPKFVGNVIAFLLNLVKTQYDAFKSYIIIHGFYFMTWFLWDRLAQKVWNLLVIRSITIPSGTTCM